MILLVSGATATIRAHARSAHIGHLLTPGNRNRESVWSTGLPVGVDNECFTKLNKPAYIAMLRALRGRRVLWVSAPDVVADARATLLRFSKWVAVLEYYGVPIAFVAQDGQENLTMPWSRIRCLFIGGSTAWKMGEHAARLIGEAHDRGKWVHVGRINSLARLGHFDQLPVDSFDGGQFSMFPDAYIPKYLERLKHQQRGFKHAA